jgi:RNA polymerase primary sigma factor
MNKPSDDRTLEAYFADVRTSVLLTAEQERALFTQYRTCTKCRWQFPIAKDHIKACLRCDAPRDYRAREQLIRGALRFVIKMANDYARMARGASHTAEDVKTLISAGNVGLLIAIDRFDLTVGTRFLTYAAWWIKEKIRDELDHSGLVHVPAYKQKHLRLRRRQGEEVSFDAAMVLLERSEAIDDSQSDDQLERNLVNTYGANTVYDALDQLQVDNREKYILLAYFGVREEPKNLRQISSRLGLSSEWVRRIKQETLLRLRTHLEAQAITDSEDLFTE